MSFNFLKNGSIFPPKVNLDSRDSIQKVKEERKSTFLKRLGGSVTTLEDPSKAKKDFWNISQSRPPPQIPPALSAPSSSIFASFFKTRIGGNEAAEYPDRKTETILEETHKIPANLKVENHLFKEKISSLESKSKTDKMTTKLPFSASNDFFKIPPIVNYEPVKEIKPPVATIDFEINESASDEKEKADLDQKRLQEERKNKEKKKKDLIKEELKKIQMENQLLAKKRLAHQISKKSKEDSIEIQSINDDESGMVNEKNHMFYFNLEDYIRNKSDCSYFISFLLGFDYFEKTRLHLSKEIPNSMQSFCNYFQTLTPLFLNESVHQLREAIMSYNKPGKRERKAEGPIEQSPRNTAQYRKAKLSYIGTGENGLINFEIEDDYSTGQASFNFSYTKNFLVIVSLKEELNIRLLNNQEGWKDTSFFATGLVYHESANSKSNHSGDKQIEMPRLYLNKTTRPFLNKKGFLSNPFLCFIFPVEKVTTNLREFLALKNIESAQLHRQVFNPQIIGYSYSELFQKTLSPFFKIIRKSYNKSQIEAIEKLTTINGGVAMLQGPPGTGKTHTLLGVLSGFYNLIKAGDTLRKVIMVCAPSNAAIDEIITRIVNNGLIGLNGERIVPRLIRVGVLDKNPSEIVKSVSLEEMAKKKVDWSERDSKASNPNSAFQSQIDKMTSEIEKLQESKADTIRLGLLVEKRRSLSNALFNQRNQIKRMKKLYQNCIEEFLTTAEIICCTLGSAGSEKLDRFIHMTEVVIVDEASQCTEPSNIIPFRFDPAKFVLVGDPKQLPATTFSPNAELTKYNRSLFERILDNNLEPFFLDTQYRMLPNIRKFPSDTFYAGRLKDCRELEENKFPFDLHFLRSYNNFFIDARYGKEFFVDSSYQNEGEALLSIKIIQKILSRVQSSNGLLHKRVGVITPYRSQVRLFSKILAERPKNERFFIELNTVDSYQGREKDIIVYSCVRSSSNDEGKSESALIGFLKDMRRLNVALTRAKYGLIIIGNPLTLSINKTWKSLLSHYEKTGSYFSVTSDSMVSGFISSLFDVPKMPLIFTVVLRFEKNPKKGNDDLKKRTHSELIKKEEKPKNEKNETNGEAKSEKKRKEKKEHLKGSILDIAIPVIHETNQTKSCFDSGAPFEDNWV